MILEFYGKECPHCVAMMPMVDKLIEEGIKIEKFEVWHDETNAEKMKEYDRGLCGGVPFFFNTETKKFLCGESDEKSLRDLASS